MTTAPRESETPEMLDHFQANGYSPYLFFNSEEWSHFRADTPLTLTADELKRLRSIGGGQIKVMSDNAQVSDEVFSVEDLRIIGRHRLLQRLYDNEWVHLAVFEPEEKVFYRYFPQLGWTPIKE